MAGLFVVKDYRHCGLGTALLEYVALKKSVLILHVYAKNVDAHFYVNHVFIVEDEQTDTDTGEHEYMMCRRIRNIQ